MTDTTLRIEPIELDRQGLGSLQSAADDPDTRWYYERRRKALVATGLLSAGSWDPMLHPRGKDGRFLDKFGFVRWLVNGNWQRGQVTSIDPNGDVKVRSSSGQDHTFTNTTAKSQLYSLPKPKAKLELPDPKAKTGATGFTQIGSQAGSNPGALYEVTATPNGNTTITSRAAKTAYRQLRAEEGGADTYKMRPVEFDANDSSQSIISKIKKRGVIFDDSRNRVFNIDEGVIRDSQTHAVVQPEELFGAPGSKERSDRLNQIDVVDGLDESASLKLHENMRQLVQAKPDVGDKFYIKTAKSKDHAKNEALANALYEMGGVSVPDVSIGADGVTVASKIVDGDKVEPLSDYVGLPGTDVMSRIRQDMVFDAWLANWDVAGLTYDNIIVVDGVPVRIDNGGSLSYRAQGGAKGSMFGPTVGEIQTLKQKSVNKQAGTVFGPVTDNELKMGGERLAAISVPDIRRAVAEAGLPESMADTLVARRADVLKQVGIDVPEPKFATKVQAAPNVDVPVKVPEENALPEDLTGMIWNPSLKNYIEGKTEPAWETGLHDYAEIVKGSHSLLSLKNATQILNDQAGGEKHHAFQGDQLYEVTAKYNHSDDSIYLTWKHVVTGDKIVTKAGTQPITNIKQGFYDNGIDLQYRGHYARHETRVVDMYDKTSEKILASTVEAGGENLEDIGIGTQIWKANEINEVLPGDWLYDRLTGRFVKVDKGTTTWIDGTYLDGSKFYTDQVTPTRFRRRMPGSSIDQVLDSMEARHKISGNSDSYDAYTNTSPGDAKLQAAIADKPNVSVTDVSAPPQFAMGQTSEDDLHPLLSLTGEPVAPSTLDFEAGQELIGKLMYVQLEENTGTVNYPNPRAQGIYTITDVQDSQHGNGVVITARDSVGHTKTFTPYGAKIEMYEVTSTIPPITQFQLKTDNTVMANGQVVGSWQKHDWGSKYTIIINPEYSVTGKEYKRTVWQKSDLKGIAIPLIVPAGSAQAKPKSEASKSLEGKIREADIKFSDPNQVTDSGEAVTLLDGAEIKKDMWVVSKTDGSIGQVVATNTSYLGYVDVKYPDGKKKIRSANTLSASADPEGKSVPIAPMYKDVKLSDGSPAVPGINVLDGANELSIIQVKADGSVRVAHADGKKTWMKSSKLAPAKPFVKDEPEDTMVILAQADQTWKTAPKAKKIPYAAPDGTTIPQSPNAVEKYREFNQVRKLTKDNFVPQIGMTVRDTKGQQGRIVRIADTTSANPSAVWVMDEWGKTTVRQPSVLWVDHAAELATGNAEPLPTVSSVYFQSSDSASNLPTGTVIYKTKGSVYLSGRYTEVDQYIAALPDGKVRQFSASSAGQGVYKNDISDMALKGITRVAYVDETSDGMMTVEGVSGGSYVTGAYIHKSEPGALEALKDEIVQAQLKSGILEPEKFAGSSNQLIKLPKPSEHDQVVPAAISVKPFAATADGSVLRGGPAVAGSNSIETGMQKLLDQRDTDTVGQSVVYAMGDSDYIEDMAIRMQMGVDQVTGEEMIEIRFGLLETQADDLSKRLITNQGSVVGDWVTHETKMPQDMKKGDAISVKISGTSGALKPGGDHWPNATIASEPVLSGVSKAGLPVYRVDVAMASGAIGHLLLEARATPSVKTFAWDPTKVAYSKQFNGTANADAVSMGWSVRNMNAVAYEGLSGHSHKMLFDEKGRKIIKKEDDGILSIASLSGAARMRYDHPAGDAHMSVQVVHPDAEMRQDSVDYNKGIRSNVNGEVLIRVKAGDPNALEKISSMMSAAGIPPEKQGQPTADDLTKMALNKIHKQYGTYYSHMDQANVNGSNDTAGVTKVLGEIDAAVGPQLGRKATLDDVLLRVMPDGRVTVVVSDDVAEAVVKKANFTHAYHSFTSGYKPEMFSSRASPGLMSTDERWSLGIVTSGMSSTTDTTNDAGNRVYFRLGAQKSGSIGHQGQMVISSQAIAKTTDWYWNSGDRFGKRSSDNHAGLKASSFGSSNEIMLKRKIDPDLVGNVVFGSESARQQAIDELKKQGVTMIGDRPVEEVMVTKATVDGVAGVGMNIGTEIPLTGLV